ncbi:hypothetical protein, partial [Alcanivorax xiamenensis]|uniref:hypothetical protein n=1 Tax=Alcanivorax xiamenensis TaxID=1177156 RepID=UPI001F17DF39
VGNPLASKLPRRLRDLVWETALGKRDHHHKNRSENVTCVAKNILLKSAENMKMFCCRTEKLPHSMPKSWRYRFDTIRFPYCHRAVFNGWDHGVLRSVITAS